MEVAIYFNHLLQIGDKLIYSLLACNNELSSLCENRQKCNEKQNTTFVASYHILIPYFVSRNLFTNYIDFLKQELLNEYLNAYI